MKINYDDIILSEEQEATLIRTIYHNPFIPIKPYNKQLYAIADINKRKLIGGSAFSGKSLLGAALACQYFEVPDYRCLIVRRTYDDVIATGGIVDYLDQWFEPYPHVAHNQSKKVFHNTQNDAKIFYNYMRYEEDKKKFKSRQYHRIIVDEASELLKVNLQFLNRSLRPNNELRIPLGLFYISNPDASSGIEYLKKNFVSNKGAHPYYEMNFWDNPFIDAEDYGETLTELSKPDYEFQMGNWDYVLKSGDIFDYDMIKAAEITLDEYLQIRNDYEILRIVRTWDIASSEKKTSDYTATSLTEFFKEGPKVVKKQQSFKLKPGRLEAKMAAIMAEDGDQVEQWVEHQPAAAGDIVDFHWAEYFKEYNVTFMPVYKNKVVRAGKIIPELKKKELFFLEDSEKPYLKIFTKQAIGFPNFDKRIDDDDESLHDDRIDTVSALYVPPKPDRIPFMPGLGSSKSLN